MQGTTTQTVAAILQKNYRPGITRQFNAATPLLRFIRQNSTDITAEGDEAIIAIETALNEGGGFHGESADVADAGHPGVERVNVRLKQLTFRIRITLKMMRKARSNAKAFARSMQQTMTSTRTAFTMTANQYLWGDGTGVQARVKSSTVGVDDKMVLDRRYGLTSGGSPEDIVRPGQVLHILDTKTFDNGVTTDRGTGTVKTVNPHTGTAGEVEVTFKAGHTFSGIQAGDYVHLQNTIQGWLDPNETEDNRPAMGLLGFYDDDLVDELQGLKKSDQPLWQPEKIPVAEATVIHDLRRARNRVSKRIERGAIDFAISSYETHERYMDALDTKVEFRNVNEIDAGWDFVDFFGRPWFMDHTSPDGRVFFKPRGNTLERYAVSDFIEFVDEGTGTMYQVPGKTVFDIMLTAIYEYGIRRRNALVSATGLTWTPS